MRYCLDSSVFINAWRKHYRPDVFPGFWKKLDELIEKKLVFSCYEVFVEIERQNDDLLEWAKDRKHIFEPADKDVTAEMSAFMAKYRSFAAIGGTSINAADPWIIVQAKLSRATIVTYEQFVERRKPTKPPKIPNVCAELNIPWMDVGNFLAANGIKF